MLRYGRKSRTPEKYGKGGISRLLIPYITDVQEIILRAKDFCNLVWLENLNLRGDYKGRILDWIHLNHPELGDIYTRKDRTYWSDLDAEMRRFCSKQGLPYVRNNDSVRTKHGEAPVVVNYFFHEEIIPSARKEQLRQTRICC